MAEVGDRVGEANALKSLASAFLNYGNVSEAQCQWSFFKVCNTLSGTTKTLKSPWIQWPMVLVQLLSLFRISRLDSKRNKLWRLARRVPVKETTDHLQLQDIVATVGVML